MSRSGRRRSTPTAPRGWGPKHTVRDGVTWIWIWKTRSRGWWELRRGSASRAPGRSPREGATLAISARRFDELRKQATDIERDTGSRCLPVQLDVTDPAGIEEAGRTIVDELGGIDICVSNSGGPTPGTFEDLDRGSAARRSRPDARLCVASCQDGDFFDASRAVAARSSSSRPAPPKSPSGTCCCRTCYDLQ